MSRGLGRRPEDLAGIWTSQGRGTAAVLDAEGVRGRDGARGSEDRAGGPSQTAR